MVMALRGKVVAEVLVVRISRCGGDGDNGGGDAGGRCRTYQ